MRRLFVMFAVAFVLAVLVAMPPAVVAQEKASKPRESSAAAGPLNLNTATAARLEKLPGIGARTAQLIVEHRQKNGGFKKVGRNATTANCCGYLDLRAFQAGWVRHGPRLGRVESAVVVDAKGILRAIPIQFTVPIDGAIGPQPHPSFIEVSCEAPLGDGHGTVAGAGEA